MSRHPVKYQHPLKLDHKGISISKWCTEHRCQLPLSSRLPSWKGLFKRHIYTPKNKTQGEKTTVKNLEAINNGGMKTDIGQKKMNQRLTMRNNPMLIMDSLPHQRQDRGTHVHLQVRVQDRTKYCRNRMRKVWLRSTQAKPVIISNGKKALVET